MNFSYSQDETFLTLLKEELERRKSKNPNYSLRCFSRDLGVSTSRLSEILNGRGKISLQSALKIANALKLDEIQKEYLTSLAELEVAEDGDHLDLIQNRINRIRRSKEFKDVEEDAFALVSDWYHYAIFELVGTVEFKCDINWISRKINLPQTTISRAISRMIKYGLLEGSESDFRVGAENIQMDFGVPSEAIRSFHKQILKKAIDALDHQSIDSRHFECLVEKVSKNDVEVVKKRIIDFQQELFKELEPSDPKDAVYALSTQFFRLDKDV